MSGIGTGVRPNSVSAAIQQLEISWADVLMWSSSLVQYDLSVSTFSPDGRVFQTDYAQKAVDSGGHVPAFSQCCYCNDWLAGCKSFADTLLFPAGPWWDSSAKMGLYW